VKKILQRKERREEKPLLSSPPHPKKPLGMHLSLDNWQKRFNIVKEKNRGGIDPQVTQRRGIMRHVRSVIGMVLVVGMCLLLAAPAMAQPRALMSEDVYTPIAVGYQLIRDGKFEAAAFEFKKATEKDMNNPFALNNLAAIESQKGNLKEAMALLQQATLKANDYKDKVEQTCFVAGLCNAVKPTKEAGPTSTIAPIIQENIAKLKAKMAASPAPPQPSTPPLMEKKQTPKDKGK